MGLHSLEPRTPEWEKDPWDFYGNQVARIRAYVEAHYERERPTFGYDKARLLAWEMYESIDSATRARSNNLSEYHLYHSASWDTWRVYQMIEQYAPRIDVVTALADLRRQFAAIDKHLRGEA